MINMTMITIMVYVPELSAKEMREKEREIKYNLMCENQKWVPVVQCGILFDHLPLKQVRSGLPTIIPS